MIIERYGKECALYYSATQIKKCIIPYLKSLYSLRKEQLTAVHAVLFYWKKRKANSEPYVKQPISIRNTALLYYETRIDIHLKYPGTTKPRNARHMPWTAACLSPLASPRYCYRNCHMSSLCFGGEKMFVTKRGSEFPARVNIFEYAFFFYHSPYYSVLTGTKPQDSLKANDVIKY
jgi:hypothetical protein